MAAASQFNKERDYWLNRLSGELSKSIFPPTIQQPTTSKTATWWETMETLPFQIEGELFSRLMKLRNGQDNILHMVLVAGIVLLLGKYSGNNDIIVGTTILKQETEANFLNTILALRNCLEPHMTFKELLLQVRQTVVEAVKHQNYPLEKLIYQLDIPESPDNFPLFDTGIILENIHDRKYFHRIKINILFSFKRNQNNLEGTVEYNPTLYDSSSINRLINHFLHLMNQVVFKIDNPLSEAQVLSQQEFKQILIDFNATETNCPNNQTVDSLFIDQAEQLPDQTAIIHKDRTLTFKHLAVRAKHLTDYIKYQRSIYPEEIVGLLMNNSPELIVSMLGIIKAGGAYVPIDPSLPLERMRYILGDAQVQTIITGEKTSNIVHQLKLELPSLTTTLYSESGDIYNLVENERKKIISKNPKTHINNNYLESINFRKKNHLVYLIYTSGTTGRPRGVMINHYNLVNYLWWAKKQYVKNKRTTFPLYTTPSFDLTVTSIFLPLTTGNTIIVYDQQHQIEGQIPIEDILEHQVVDMVKSTPSHLKIIQYTYMDSELKGGLKSLINHFRINTLIVGGEELTTKLSCDISHLFSGCVDIYNEYGPTETTVGCMIHKFNDSTDNRVGVPIGKPIDNVKIFLLDVSLNPVPIGASGEIYIGGNSVARGYANLPELTAEKFIKNPFLTNRTSSEDYLYKTGDLACMLPMGIIEFKGRKDEQVKIRGYRIELKDIENCLLGFKKIDKVVVIALSDDEGETYLAAYYEARKELGVNEIRNHVAEELPNYMIPSYFIYINRIPLTINGKINKNALPKIKVINSSHKYIPPRNQLEETLVEIWSGVLKIDKKKISIDSDFFELGGHSLRGTILVSTIHKQMNVKVPLSILFKTPNIRSLAHYIKRRKEKTFLSISPVEKKEYYPLSSTQRRIYILQHLVENNIGYNEFSVIELKGRLNKEKLENVFKELVSRHESLRTSFIRLGDNILQKIHSVEDIGFHIETIKIRGESLEEIVTRFLKPFDLEKAPLLRVQLAQLGEERYYLIYDLHHIITDGTSMAILMKEFALLYQDAKLEPLRLQYKDYSQWQNSEAGEKTLKMQEAYWIGEFRDEIPVLELYTDYPRPEVQNFAGDWMHFTLGEEETQILKSFAIKQEVTLFMLLLSIYNVLLLKISGQEDIIIGTPIAARGHADLQQIIGMFVNTLALRNYPRGDKFFVDFLKEIKSKTLKGFENQEYPFEELVEKIAIQQTMGRNPLFDTILAVQNMEVVSSNKSDTQITGIEITKPETPHKISKFDLTIHVNESKGKLLFTLEYSTSLYKKETIERYFNYFKQSVFILTEHPSQKINEIEIISAEEKKLILNQFNNTNTEYPEDETFTELFEKQVEKTSDRIALIDDHIQLTYRNLNERSFHLVKALRRTGLRCGDIAAVMMNQSIELIITLVAILKSSIAILPIDPIYPQERQYYMLKDSRAKILIAANDSSIEKLKQLKRNNDIKILSLDNHASPPTQISDYSPPPYPLLLKTENRSQPTSLAYIIYTSGTSGRPKGVMIEHHSLINLCYWHRHYYKVDTWDRASKYAGIGFDASIWEIFPYLLTGASLCIVPTKIKLELNELNCYFERKNITITFLPTQICEQFTELENNSLRILLTGGDKLRHFKKKRYEIYNNYGPTENAVVTTSCLVEEYQTNIPIGKPIANTGIFILDHWSKKLQPIGIPGELCVGGDSVARGYLNNPEMTFDKFSQELKFLWDSRNKQKYEDNKMILRESEFIHKKILIRCRLYKSGDLARWKIDGNIEFLGRIDSQVKVRGNRIEPGEIEHVLLKHDKISTTYVKAYRKSNSETYLCAYIVLAPDISITKIRKYLNEILPDYMIPAHLIKVDQIPLTPNGKVDIHALPTPAIKTTQKRFLPRNKIEKQIQEIWSQVLGIKRDLIGIDANFFELGGHSLKASNMVSKIHQILEIKVPLTVLFRKPTIREVSDYIKKIEKNKFEPITPIEEREYYSLSPAQKRIFILQQISEDTSYNMPYIIHLNENFQKDKLESIFKKLIKRHESLRTFFITIRGEPAQIVKKEVNFSIDSISESEEETYKMVYKLTKSFDLSKPPLIRIYLITNSESKQLLFIDMHHIITDGTSHEILKKEFMSLHKGLKLPPLKLKYKDYSQWCNSVNQREVTKKQQKYWLNEFSGELPSLDLPIDNPRPQLQGTEGNMVNFNLDIQETIMVKSVIKKYGITLYMFLLAAFNILLSKLSGQEDIIIGTPIAARRHTDLEYVIGMLVNTLALRNYPIGEKKINQFIYEVGERTLEAFENQEYPFEELVENLKLERDVGRNPVFDVMFNLLNIADHQDHESKSIYRNSRRHIKGTSKFDLSLAAIDMDERINFNITYNTKLFESNTIDRFIGYFYKILKILSIDSELKISEIEILSEEEKNILLYDFNATTGEYPQGKSIHRLFEKQMEITPDRMAIVSTRLSNEGKENHIEDIHQLTYQELNNKSENLAFFLKSMGQTFDNTVGLMVERSSEMIIGIIGILKANSAFLPINPHYPVQRINFILKDSGTKLLLTSSNDININNLYTPFHTDHFSIPNLQIKIKTEGDSIINKNTFLNSTELKSDDRLAYIIYTSGSTGIPKGVMVNHSSLVNLIHYQYSFFKIVEDDRVLQFSSISFDPSIEQIFLALTSGALLVLVKEEVIMDNEEFEHWISKQKVTHLHAVPTFLAQLKFKRGYHLKRIVSGGDTCPVKLVKEWRKYCFFFNKYGPTETTITSIETEIDKLSHSSNILPIGKPIGNTRVYILDKWMSPVPIKVVGELYIGGAGVTRGYLNQPELTAEKFSYKLPKTFLRRGIVTFKNILLNHSSTPLLTHSTIYRTGDLARWRQDGNIEFLGRVDYQVKIRGMRIEPNEIEMLLRTNKNIKESIVVVREHLNGEKHLCAYIVLNPDAAENFGSGEIRDYLSTKLPNHMVPSFIIPLESLPLNDNGKIDRKALPEPRHVKMGSKYSPPRNRIEKTVIQLWADSLTTEFNEIGIDDNFFELGGHSLKASIVVSRIHKELGVKISLSEIFTKSTPRKLAEFIATQKTDIYTSINPTEKKDYYPVSNAQKRLYILQQVENDSIGYNEPLSLLMKGKLDIEKLKNTFQQIIQKHESLRTSFEMTDDKIVQRIHDKVEFKLKYYDNKLAMKNSKTIFQSFIRPFDLSEAPLMRAGLINTADNTHILIVDIHHIVTDGVSTLVILNEAAMFLASVDLEPIKVQYKDFSEWQNAFFTSEEIRKQEKYWLEKFKDGEVQMELPLDYSRPETLNFAGDLINFELEMEETKLLKKIAANEDISLFMVLLSVFNIFLSKVCDREDIIVGTPIAGRKHEDLKKIVGFFVNMLPLRNFIEADKTFQEFLSEVRNNTLEAYDNQDYPFDILVDKICHNRNAGRNSLIDVVFVFHNMDVNVGKTKNVEIPGMLISPYIEHKKNVSAFDIILHGREMEEKLFMSFHYRTSLFKRETIQRFIRNFKEIISLLSANINIKLGDIKLNHDLLFVKPEKTIDIQNDFLF